MMFQEGYKLPRSTTFVVELGLGFDAKVRPGAGGRITSELSYWELRFQNDS